MRDDFLKFEYDIENANIWLIISNLTCGSYLVQILMQTTLANYKCKNFETWHRNVYILKTPFKNPPYINVLFAAAEIPFTIMSFAFLLPVPSAKVVKRVLIKCRKKKYQI